MSEVERALRFLYEYAERSGMSPADLLKRRVVATCGCDYEYCEGFQVVPAQGMVGLSGERVLIEGGEA